MPMNKRSQSVQSDAWIKNKNHSQVVTSVVTANIILKRWICQIKSLTFFKLIHLTTSDNDYECGEDLFYVTEFEEESIKRNKF